MPTSAVSSSSLATSSSSLTTNGNSQLSSTDYMIKEAERFESFYKDVLKFHDLLENIDNILLRRQLREIINKIEDDFVNEPELTTPKCMMYDTVRLGIIGGSLSGKSALLQRFITGEYISDDSTAGKHKKVIDVNGTSNLMLIRDETGPPDTQFSLWVDAVLLVFNVADELSFNVISSYYAKMLQYRNDKEELPCILVAIKDVDRFDSNYGAVQESRIKKFISDHRNCPFYCVSLETGEKVDEAFLAAAERIIQVKNFPNISSYNTLLSSSLSSFSNADGASINSQNGANTPQKKYKRRNTLFSMKTSEKKEKEEVKISIDDFGSGRRIPIKQGYLYKRNQSSLKEWKKKYVLITDDQVFSYYPSMKDYMDDSNMKSIKLIHSSVKVPGGRRNNKSANQINLHKSSGKSFSSQNIANILSSPIKNRSNRNSASEPLDQRAEDCYVISNSSISEPSTELELSSGSPTIHQHGLIERSFSDGRDIGPPQNLRNAQSYDSFSAKHKNRKQKDSNRYKSCEIDYQPNSTVTTPRQQTNSAVTTPRSGEGGSDVECTVPLTPVIRKKSFQHKRQKSSTNLNAQDLRATDTEDNDSVFSLVTIDGKTWDFECACSEDRDSWVQMIEQQILKAFQDNKRKFSDTDESCKSQFDQENECNVQEKLYAVGGNDKCADCNAQAPEWASLNIGVLICIECSGVHRNLGSHLSRVRSVLLDDWPNECVTVLESLGNTFVNNIYESNLSGKIKPKPNASREERERWISFKYEKREFITPVVDRTTVKTKLMLGVESEDIQQCYLQLIHSKTKDVNGTSTVSGYDFQLAPLHLACAKSNVPITQLLLWYNGDPKILDERGYNPIFYANKSNSKQCADLLFSYGCPEDTPC